MNECTSLLLSELVAMFLQSIPAADKDPTELAKPGEEAKNLNSQEPESWNRTLKENIDWGF